MNPEQKDSNLVVQYSKLATCLLAGMVFLFACRSNEVGLPPDHIILQAGESVLAPAGLTIIADTVTVAICPKNASCIIADFVSVSIRVMKDSTSKRVHLNAPINNYKPKANTVRFDSTGVVFGNQSYKIILREGRYIDGSEFYTKGEAIIQVSRL